MKITPKFSVITEGFHYRALISRALCLGAQPKRGLFSYMLRFYVQVEQKRLGLDRSTPLVVQQWTALIAISYAARKFGECGSQAYAAA